MGELLFFDTSNERYSCAENLFLPFFVKVSVSKPYSQEDVFLKMTSLRLLIPFFSKIPGCRNYMPKFCRFGIIAISRTAAT